jgi:Fe-S-cluster containining protein
MEQAKEALVRIYDDFEKEAAPYKTDAACKKGCAFCCTDAGSIHITTLEGRIIRDAMARLPRQGRTTLQKSLMKDMKKREAGRPSPCPFLMKNRACMIYAIRPFVCRRVYSTRTCTQGTPPMLSRQVMGIADRTIRKLQALDSTGYSGHLSYILYMLDQPKFRGTYLAGDFKPEEIVVFGKRHGILINRMPGERTATGSGTGC